MDDVCSSLFVILNFAGIRKLLIRVFSPLHSHPWHMSSCFLYVFTMLLFLEFFVFYDKMLISFKRGCYQLGLG